MAEHVEGGRPHRINGLSMSDEEHDIVVRASRKMKKAKAEFIRDAAVAAGHEILTGKRQAEFEMTAEDLADPEVGAAILAAIKLARARRARLTRRSR